MVSEEAATSETGSSVGACRTDKQLSQNCKERSGPCVSKDDLLVRADQGDGEEERRSC